MFKMQMLFIIDIIIWNRSTNNCANS